MSNLELKLTKSKMIDVKLIQAHYAKTFNTNFEA